MSAAHRRSFAQDCAQRLGERRMLLQWRADYDVGASIVESAFAVGVYYSTRPLNVYTCLVDHWDFQVYDGKLAWTWMVGSETRDEATEKMDWRALCWLNRAAQSWIPTDSEHAVLLNRAAQIKGRRANR